MGEWCVYPVLFHITSEHGLSSIANNNKNMRQAVDQHGKLWIDQ